MDQQLHIPIKNAGLYSALRSYVAEAFRVLATDRQEGADISFGIEEHRRLRDDKPFYEYRPMTERFVADRIEEIRELAAAHEAQWVLASDPACSAFLRAGRSDAVADLEIAARDEILEPMLYAMAEHAPTFEIEDDVLLRHYLRFEKGLYSEARRYAATTPLWGVRLMYGDLEVAKGVTIRAVDPEWFRLEWPEAAQLDWGDGSRDGLPTAMLQFERQVEAIDDETAIDPLGAIVDVVSAIRALAGGSITAGPLVMERLDWRATSPRPVPAVAARRCGNIPSRIDATVAANLPGAVKRLASMPDSTLARAIERYQFAATAHGLSALRGVHDMLIEIYANDREIGSAALRLAAVVGASLPERRAIVDAVNEAHAIISSGQPPADSAITITRTLAAALRATIAAALIGELPITSLQAYADSILIGERERKQLGIAVMQPLMNDTE